MVLLTKISSAKNSNQRIKVVRFAHSTAQELRTCAALYAHRWASQSEYQ